VQGEGLRVQALISQKQPRDPEDCFRYLNDPQVRMHMTAQQMVFYAASAAHTQKRRHTINSGPPPILQITPRRRPSSTMIR